jgi:hypothetical protein
LLDPGGEQFEEAKAIPLTREANDFLADAVKKHRTRLAGLAAVPSAAPDRAAAELERLVRGHGFKGAVINGHIRGGYLDDTFFWPILERAAALNVPIYLHPTRPPQVVIDASHGGSALAVTDMVAGPGWGGHIETAIHVIRGRGPLDIAAGRVVDDLAAPGPGTVSVPVHRRRRTVERSRRRWAYAIRVGPGIIGSCCPIAMMPDEAPDAIKRRRDTGESADSHGRRKRKETQAVNKSAWNALAWVLSISVAC